MWSVENCWHGAYANVRQIARLPEQRCWQKKAKCRKAANSASSGAKRRFPIESKKFFPADVLCAFANTHARASTRKNCLYGNEPGGNRTHDLLLRRDAHRFPFRELHCPVMPDFPAFPADFYVFDGGQRNVKNRNFQPCC